MDHISTPEKYTIKPLIIPLYVTDKYRYRWEGFFEFLKSKLFTREYLLSKEAKPQPVQDFLSFLQSWAFFALLQETFSVLSIAVGEHDFISRHENDRTIITTRKLPELLDSWTRQQGLEPSKSDLLKLARFLVLVNEYLGLINDDGPVVLIQQHLNSQDIQALNELALHIGCVAEAIGTVVFHYTGHRYIQVRLVPNLMERYREAGWCPHLVKAVKKDISFYTAHYYNSFLDRRSSDQDHSPCWESDTCVVFRGLVEDYRNPHALECDEIMCQYCKLNEEQATTLGNIIRDGEIPALTVSENEDGKVTLEIHQYLRPKQPQRPRDERHQVLAYAAFSHVWLDGLGDHLGVDMRSCQLLRLQRLVDQALVVLGPPVPFWIDILCVPLERELRWLALDGMRHVYRHAQATLVLDRHIQKLEFDDPVEQIAQTVIASNWRIRLWTLQEGLLAQQLIFCLKDLFFSPTILFARYLQTLQERDPALLQDDPASRREIIDRKVSTDLLFLVGYGVISTGGDLALDPDEPAKVLAQLIDRLAARSTSKREDETICLSILLGQEPSKYCELSESHEERQRAFFSSLTEVPLGLIFRSGPRVSGEGCSWMPLSLLRSAWQPEMPHIDATGHPSEKGLRFSLASFHIKVSRADADRAVEKGLIVYLDGHESLTFWAAFVYLTKETGHHVAGLSSQMSLWD